MNAVGPEEFGAQVVQVFPELRATLAPKAGGLHQQVSDFAEFTQSAKEQGNWPTYERCVQLADQLLAGSNAALADALRTEFVSHLDFEGSRGPAAWQMLPAALQAAWRQVDAENRRLMALPQKRSPQAGFGQREPRRQPRGPKPKGPPGGGPRGPKGPKGRRGRGRGRR